VDLSSFSEDANHDESTKDSSNLKEEYMADITENNVRGVQSEILEIENTNEGDISNLSCTETGDTSSAVLGELNGNAKPGVTLNQTDNNLVLNQNLQLLSNCQVARHTKQKKITY